MNVVNVDPYLPTDTNNRQNTVVSTPVSPLIVAWNNRTVAVVRYDAYDDQIEAVRRARGFQALGGRPFHLEASLPGYGAEAHEISEDLWPHVVRTLRTVTLALDENTPNALDPSAIAGQPDSPHVSDSRTSRSSGGRIFMRSINGRTTEIEIDSFGTTTVYDLKSLYQARENLPIRNQGLISNGEKLEDNRTLQDSNVHNESTIWVTVRLSPGKPVIYLFPPHLIVDASVVLGLTPSWSFSAVYPKARDVSPDNGLHAIEWTVDARADGVLVDKASGSELSYLFWEAHTYPAPSLSPPISRPSTPTEDEDKPVHFDPARPRLSPRGAVLLGVEKLPIYLDHALKELSLHTEARNSFITYWLPSFLKHKHIALRFLSQDSYEAAAPMTVTPAPDVVTRVFMLFKGIDERDLGTWAEAEARATHDVAFWKKAVGVDAERAEDRGLFRVLEWGGMEVI